MKKQEPVDAGIPDIIEERRKDAEGRVLSFKYLRGKLLGKVRHHRISINTSLFIKSISHISPSATRAEQGGFAKCFLGTSLQSKTQYALKIVAKNTLVKPRAKQKVCGYCI